MNAPIRHQQIRVDPLAVFKARAEARAILWAACEIDLLDAVDILQADAVSTGLVAGLGQDAVQRILADAFHSEAHRCDSVIITVRAHEVR